ncbi:hypothetical protein ACWGLG_45085 [Streptomyces antimycoticus]|uniref:hypothetical protein n=1 Tax=Streptomyces antimycoticus TaxID=68175 RepID=UPI001D151E83|nr:hypothetical protein [Streptomyces antimycoticus]
MPPRRSIRPSAHRSWPTGSSWGSDAQRRIGVKLDQLRAEFEAGRELAFSTDFPGAADNAVL